MSVVARRPPLATTSLVIVVRHIVELGQQETPVPPNPQ